VKKVIFIFFLLFTCEAFADEFPAQQNPPRLVNDFAEILNDDEEYRLENKLRAYNDSTSSQIAIVTVRNIGDYEIGDYAERLAEKWAIGQKGKDNGILIFVAVENHKAWIAVGYGLEGVIPDATAKNIYENYMKPRFKENNFYQGFEDATTIIIKLASGEYKADDIKKGGTKSRVWMIILALIVGYIILKAIFGRGRYGTYSSGGYTGGGGFFSGGESGGGSDFGGFGGGDFGGGGAGGSW
jgi:uncharacterized protein